MPAAKEHTLTYLAETGRGLRLRCISCGFNRVLSPLEAIASYGGLMRFTEVREALKARCEARLNAKCEALIGPTADRYVPPTAKRRTGEV